MLPLGSSCAPVVSLAKVNNLAGTVSSGLTSCSADPHAWLLFHHIHRLCLCLLLAPRGCKMKNYLIVNGDSKSLQAPKMKLQHLVAQSACSVRWWGFKTGSEITLQKEGSRQRCGGAALWQAKRWHGIEGAVEKLRKTDGSCSLSVPGELKATALKRNVFVILRCGGKKKWKYTNVCLAGCNRLTGVSPMLWNGPLSLTRKIAI